MPWGSNEWTWRAAVAEAARNSRDDDRASNLSGSRFSVSISFFFLPANIGMPDLDNLAKPVLDTLFKPTFPQVKDMNLTGALFDIDDSAVFELKVSKEEIADVTEEGARITVAWQ